MKKEYIVLLVVAAFMMGFVTHKATEKITADDVRAAQRLIGLNFTSVQIDTMLTYLERNKRGYDSMRTFHLAYDIDPAMSFDPFPLGLMIDTEMSRNIWALDSEVELPSTDEEIAYLPVTALAALIKSRKLSSVALTKIYLDRIKKYDDQLLSFVTVTEMVALEQAQRADNEIDAGNYRGPLHGIPYGIKDLAAYPSYPTTWGAYPYRNQYIDQTATVISKLEEAGAVLLGKLVSGTLARGDVWFGGKTVNPWDVTQGASGSSAGPGAATSAALVAFSIGTETLGSIVSPASRCGVTGLRPTYGRVSRAGLMVLSWSMDKVGPMCRTATDCAIVLDAIIGADHFDRSVINAKFDYLGSTDLSKLRVGYFHQQFASDTGATGKYNQRVLDEMGKLGIKPIPVDLPSGYPFGVFDIILRAESGAFFDDLVLAGSDSLLEEQDRGSRANSLRQSRFIPAVEYIQANRHRRKLIEEFHAAIKDFDVVISPTFGGNQMLITNLTGHPALAIPTGFDDKGRPTSITLVANYFEEAKLIALAEAYQLATDYEGRVPPGFK